MSGKRGKRGGRCKGVVARAEFRAVVVKRCPKKNERKRKRVAMGRCRRLARRRDVPESSSDHLTFFTPLYTSMSSLSLLLSLSPEAPPDPMERGGGRRQRAAKADCV
jgi:hypothetical protein